jgi:hypothetical protein
MLVLHCLMLSQFFSNPLLLGSQFLCGGVRKLASSPQTYTHQRTLHRPGKGDGKPNELF